MRLSGHLYLLIDNCKWAQMHIYVYICIYVCGVCQFTRIVLPLRGTLFARMSRHADQELTTMEPHFASLTDFVSRQSVYKTVFVNGLAVGKVGGPGMLEHNPAPPPARKKGIVLVRERGGVGHP